MLFPYDSTIVYVLPAILLALYAQFKVRSTFEKYSKTLNSKGFTGSAVAKLLLERSHIFDVVVEPAKGLLTDHYDPKEKVLRLSEEVYNSSSLSAIGVAAHETGHAIQHDEGYIPLTIRGTMLPIVMVSSQLATPLIFIGLLIASGSNIASGSFGSILLNTGIILFSIVVLFQIVTLPVEFNASKRALEMLGEEGIMMVDEIPPAKKILNAAALTYVASVAVSILNLLRFLSLSSRRR